MHLKSTIYESTLSTAGAVPLPQWGRQRNEDAAFLDTTPFQRGKAKRRRLRRPKRKPIPPRCARQPLPREGARVDTPSFLWKEVPRRGGGWMGESGMKKSGKDRHKCVLYESTRAPQKRKPTPPRCARQPLPREGARVDTSSFLWRRLRYEDGSILDIKPSFWDVSILFSCRLRS